MKQLLFISYYFPPSGGPGVQRSLKFVKYLADFGWNPTVVTVRPEHASYPDLDPALMRDVPPSTRVERTYAWDPYAMYANVLGRSKQDVVSVGFLGEAETNFRQRIARWVRANVFLPDARVGWVPFAAARGHALLERDGFDAMLTTGPPHSTHLAGLLLHLMHGTPWLVDLRDPWTGIDYYADLPMSPLARAVDAWMEGLVLNNASAGTVVSESMGRSLLERARLPLKVIENGFDPADVEEIDAGPPEDRFVVRHVGSLNQARNPTVLWKALAALRPDETMPELRLVFTGNVEPAVLQAAAAYGLDHLIETSAYVPHEKAIALMHEATLLLLCINRVEGAEGIVTGKLYEYVASGRPVLGIGPPAGDAARVLGATDAGRMFGFDDVAGVHAYLRASYNAWKSGRGLTGARPERAARYSRREQTRKLADMLSSMLPDTSPH
ncbi:MAG: glycosyltransferase [Rhodothermales bacterium]